MRHPVRGVIDDGSRYPGADDRDLEVDFEEKKEQSQDWGVLVGTSEDEPVIIRGYD